jgi:arylsulfatase A-like enzyme
MTRPNILWICTDQQRYDTIASLGNGHIRTPNLDRLVSEGVAFTHAFAQNSVCTPSRASFLTGRYPRTTRTRQNGQNIPADEVLITKMLADAGYDCGLSGKLHLSACDPRYCKTIERRIDDGYRVFHWSHHPNPDWPENAYIKWLQAKGYQWKDVYEGPKGRHAYPGVPSELHQTTWCFEKAIEFITEERHGPWLMSINCFDPHHPFDPPKDFLERYDPEAVPVPKYRPGELERKPHFQKIDSGGAYGGHGMSFAKMTPRQHREVTAAYYAMIEAIDEQVGRIVRALDESGQRENTIVIFMSDHGEMLGDHGIYLKGPYLYDCAIRVPLIVSWPGHFKAGLRSDALVELVDLVPTLLDSIGMPIPRRVQGRSFFNLCTGKAAPHEHRDFVYAEDYNSLIGHRSCKPRPYVTMIRTRTHKISVVHGMELGELYDLEKDRDEVENLWDNPSHQDVKYQLMKRCFDASVFTMEPMPERVAGW